MKLQYTTVGSEPDILGILALQQQNLRRNLSPEAIDSQGFVTVEHDYATMKTMNEAAPSIIAKIGDEVVGYNLAMLPQFSKLIPVLVPMFDLIDSLEYGGVRLGERKYIVCGQVCVAKSQRGTGVFAGMYAYYHDTYAADFDIIITEIASSNLRSLRAHDKVGFRTVHTYTAPDGLLWDIVLWDWNK